MKKIISLILASVLVLSFVGCSKKTSAVNNSTSKTTASEEQKADIVFKDATYVTYINDIYANGDKYIGKTIEIDGMYTYQDSTNQAGKRYYYVYRQGPGCCGNDGSMCGFEFTVAEGVSYPDYSPKNGDANKSHPWIKVTGKLERYYEGSEGPYYTLSNSKIEIMPDSERGKEIVSL